MEFRKATEDDIEAVMALVNRAYHVTETGNTGVAFKSTPRYGHWRNFIHRWTRSKILEGGVVSFPEGRCKFFKSEGGYPPLTPKKFSPAAVTIFYSTFFH